MTDRQTTDAYGNNKMSTVRGVGGGGDIIIHDVQKIYISFISEENC